MPLVLKYAKRPPKGGMGFGLLRKAGDVLNVVADAVAPKMRKVIVEELDRVLSPRELENMARAVRQGDVAAIMQSLPAYDPDNPGPWEGLQDAYRGQVADVAQRAGQKALQTYGIRSSFSIDNPYTARWLRENTAARITAIADDARAGIKGLVTRAWTDGIPPDRLAALIQPHIGLAPNNAAAVERRFASTAAALEDGGMPRTQALGVAADRARTYAEDLVEQRAETIARTETIAASTAATQDAWTHAKDQGLIPEEAQREWVSSPEGLGACVWCEELDGVRTPFDEPFPTGMPGLGGSIDRPPLHPRCRCVCRILIPGLNDAQSLDQIREQNAAESE